MATIHIRDIQRLLAERGSEDALPHSPAGYFLEIRFDEPDRPAGVVDPDLQDKVLTAESSYGSVTIQFDGEGRLRSIDLS